MWWLASIIRTGGLRWQNWWLGLVQPVTAGMMGRITFKMLSLIVFESHVRLSGTHLSTHTEWGNHPPDRLYQHYVASDDSHMCLLCIVCTTSQYVKPSFFVVTEYKCLQGPIFLFFHLSARAFVLHSCEFCFSCLSVVSKSSRLSAGI